VITHVPPWHDAETIFAESAIFGGPRELAVPGMVYEL